MTPSQKLKFIQKISGLTQQELAFKIGVTFAALNRWINNQAQPRAKALQKIDELYLEYSGEKIVPQNILEAKKRLILSKSGSKKNILELISSRPDIRDQLDLSLTYNSNKIEGSTLTENETGAILFHNKALPHKTLAEQLEAKNHQTALHFVFDFAHKKNAIDENFILKLHSILLSGIHPDAGYYRRHGVRIVGTQVVTANYVKIPFLMEELINEIDRNGEEVVARVARVHAGFEQIHPFGDGNGRVGRLLMNCMLLKENSAPALIKQEDRQKYFLFLSKAQLKEEYSLLEDFICDAILEGFKIFE